MSAEIVRTSEWQEFVEWLTVAWQKYCDKPPGAREGAIRTLLATAFFIKRVDPTKRTTLAKMFSDLACALIELDSWIRGPDSAPQAV